MDTFLAVEALSLVSGSYTNSGPLLSSAQSQSLPYKSADSKPSNNLSYFFTFPKNKSYPSEFFSFPQDKSLIMAILALMMS